MQDKLARPNSKSLPTGTTKPSGALLTILRETARKYRKELTEPEIKLWLEALAAYSATQVADAFKAHMRDSETCQFFPIEGQILERLKPEPYYQKPYQMLKEQPDCEECRDLGVIETVTKKGNRAVRRCACREKRA
jgi:hypothetical protein